jgi:hypothetical protein
MPKIVKGFLLLLSTMILLSVTCFAEESTNKFDAEYTGMIIGSDKHFILVKMTDQERYSGIQMGDKHGFVVDEDTIQGKLCNLGSSIVISDSTQSSSFTGKVRFIADSWKDIERWWNLRYDMTYFD